MLNYLIIFWFVREIKAVLFWLYLWQLKEYHIGRFLDHFRTERGRKLLVNKLLFLKVFLLLSFLLAEYYYNIACQNKLFEFFEVSFFYILFLLYIAEAAKVFYDIARGKLTKPFFTKKIIFLSAVSFIFTGVFFIYIIALYRSVIGYFFAGLLLFDILAPLIVSLIVLMFQPLAVLGRNRIIAAARKKRARHKKLLVIGITGSYGKTSTKEMLAEILSKKFKVLKTEKHQNSEVGISLCVLNDLKPEHEIFVCEMGAYNKGGIKLLCGIAKPKIGIITGVNEQHLATFGTMENLLSAEGGAELIDSLPEDGISFFNGKNKYCRQLYQKTKVKKFLYGEDVELPGMENIEGAKKAAKELGMSEEEIKSACRKIENKFPGIQLKKGANGLNIIDAAYSANPDGVMAHLEYLKTFSGKKVIIMPCLIELGRASKEVHQRIGKKIGSVCDLAIITKKECFGAIKEAATGAGLKEENIFLEDDPEIIHNRISGFCREEDVMLLEGRLPEEIIKLLSE